MAKYNFAVMEAARKKQQMEFVELAYRVGLSETHVRQILAGSTGCTEKTMWKIADVLELEPEELEPRNHKKR